MAVVVGALRADLETNVAQFSSDMEKAAGSVDKFTRKAKNSAKETQRATSGLDNFAKGLRGGFAGAAAAGLAFFTASSVEAASSLDELEGEIDVTFGAMADHVTKWSERTSDDIGRAASDLRRHAKTFGTVFQDVTGEIENAKLSEAFATLAVDMAAFFNTTEEAAGQALQSGLTGSTRALKRYGVQLTEQEVLQKAVNLGLAETTDLVTEQDKVVARAALIWEKTSKVQGEAARGANDFEGATKRLQGQVKELSENFGKALLPALTAIAGALSDILNGWNDLWSSMGQEIGLMAARWEFGEEAVNKAWKEIQAARAAEDEAAKSGENLAESFNSIDAEGAHSAETLARLRREAEQLADTQQRLTIAVLDFGVGTYDAQARELVELRRDHQALETDIQRQIKTLEEAGGASNKYAAEIANLRGLLFALHHNFRETEEAVRKLQAAQLDAADANASVAADQMRRGTRELDRAAGGAGFITENQQRVLDLEENLASERLRAAADLKALEAARAEAAFDQDQAEIARLDQQIELQREYGALVNEVTATQIFAQEKLQAMIGEYFDITSASLADAFKGVRDAGSNFDWNAWGANFVQRMSDSVLERKADQLTENIFDFLGLDMGKTQDVKTLNATTLNILSGGISGGQAFGGFAGGPAPLNEGGLGGLLQQGLNFLGKTFGGFFGEGGSLMPGEWGIAGEHGPELLRGGAHGMEVEPDLGAGGVRDQNFIFPGANVDGFKANQRQIAQAARRQFS